MAVHVFVCFFQPMMDIRSRTYLLAPWAGTPRGACIERTNHANKLVKLLRCCHFDCTKHGHTAIHMQEPKTQQSKLQVTVCLLSHTVTRTHHHSTCPNLCRKRLQWFASATTISPPAQPRPAAFLNAAGLCRAMSISISSAVRNDARDAGGYLWHIT